MGYPTTKLAQCFSCSLVLYAELSSHKSFQICLNCVQKYTSLWMRCAPKSITNRKIAYIKILMSIIYMSSEYSFSVDSDADILLLYGRLKRHVVIHEPPFSIESIMFPFLRREGRPIRVIVHHRSREVQIVESSLSRHVLQTTIRAFQRHRLPDISSRQTLRVRPVQDQVEPRRGEATQRSCPICFDNICSSDGLALPCMHAFHEGCIRTWLSNHNTCPVCRHSV